MLIEEDPDQLTYEDACMFAMQGLHPELEDLFESDPGQEKDSLQDLGALFVVQQHMSETSSTAQQ